MQSPSALRPRHELRGAIGRGCAIGLALAAALVLVLLIVGGSVVSKYNGLQTGKQDVQGKFAAIDAQYKRRFDLIPQLVETVKGAANFEKSTLESITEARASVGKMQMPADALQDPAKLKQYMDAQASLGGALSRLLVVSEQYPTLKANQNFLSLQDQLEGTENRISFARTQYIESVQRFNTQLSTFPGNVIGGMFGMQVLPQLEAATPDERKVPAVKFDFDGAAKK